MLSSLLRSAHVASVFLAACAQLVAASVFALLVAAFYVVLGPYIGNTLAGNILLATFSFSVRTSISALTESSQLLFCAGLVVFRMLNR